MSDPAIQIGQYTTTCLLCHKNVAISKPLNIPESGDPGRNAEKLTGVLLQHLMKKHPHEFAFYIFSAFHCEDPTLQARLEKIRVGIFDAIGIAQPTT